MFFMTVLSDQAGLWEASWEQRWAPREGQLIENILSYPENWTVDAAGAIVSVTPASRPSSATKSRMTPMPDICASCRRQQIPALRLGHLVTPTLLQRRNSSKAESERLVKMA